MPISHAEIEIKRRPSSSLRMPLLATKQALYGQALISASIFYFSIFYFLLFLLRPNPEKRHK